MTRIPIELLMDGITWNSLPGKWPFESDVPVATHSGILTIGGISLQVYQLSNGQRVIAEEDLEKLFGKEILAKFAGKVQKFKS